MLDPAYREQTIEQLERTVWGEPALHSHLVTECHRLRKVRLKDFTVEHLRIMLGQNVGVEFLLPIAIDELIKNPLVSGDFYDGDLLSSVLRIEVSFWKSHSDAWQTVKNIVEQNLAFIYSANQGTDERQEFDRLFESFLAKS